MMTASEKDKKPINDIDMDYFGSSDNRLGTTGINTCIGFIIIFNHGEHVL